MKILRMLFLVAVIPVVSCAQDTERQQLRDDIGQMLLVGFRGTSIDKQSHIVRDIEKYHIGGVILFEYDAPTGRHHRNVESPKQLKRLCHDLKALSSTPLWISIDQEGGKVSRMKAADGFAAVGSPKRTAEGGDDSVARAARITAQMLHTAGINLNFAPCADVDVNPQCPVIGRLGRSFSADPKMVARYCRIWLDRQTEYGVMGCLKHFPGHGSASGDTHSGLVDVTDNWSKSELEPYRLLFEQGKVPMVMIAHIVNRKIDSVYPASLSKQCVTGLLRDEMGFDGVVITDDMAMGAIVNEYGYAEAVALALQAGVDVLCLSNNGTKYDPDIVPKTMEIVLRLVAEKKLSADRIHASADRIRRAKQMYLASGF